jgi:hypothetical protein
MHWEFAQDRLTEVLLRTVAVPLWCLSLITSHLAAPNTIVFTVNNKILLPVILRNYLSYLQFALTIGCSNPSFLLDSKKQVIELNGFSKIFQKPKSHFSFVNSPLC